MRSGAIVAKMNTICFVEPPTLDAVLGGMAFQEHHDGERAAIVPEIKRRDGVPMASRAILVGQNGSTIRAHTRNLNRHFVANPAIIQTVSEKTWRKDFQKTPPGAIILTENVVRNIEAVVFIAVCDPEIVLRRFADSPRIGTNRKNYGAVSDVEWVDLPDMDTTGIIGQGQLLRPVPRSKADALGSFDSHTRFGFWQNPYHPAVAAKAGIDAEPVCYPPDIIGAISVDDALGYGLS